MKTFPFAGNPSRYLAIRRAAAWLLAGVPIVLTVLVFSQAGATPTPLESADPAVALTELASAPTAEAVAHTEVLAACHHEHELGNHTHCPMCAVAIPVVSVSLSESAPSDLPGYRAYLDAFFSDRLLRPPIVSTITA
jgi:hypothetical protein